MVLLIVTLLLGGLLVPLSAQIDRQRTKETQKTLAELKEVLIGFAVVNGRLPCPALSTSSNGQESFCSNATGACGALLNTYQAHGRCSNPYDGLVPAASLGMTPVNAQGFLLDGWNNPVRYAVNEKIGAFNYALTTTNGMKNATISSLAAANLLYVCSSKTGITPASCGTPTPPTIKLTDKAPALVYSLGKNGSSAGAGLDEAANGDNDPVFVSHEQTQLGAANGEFDDIVVWLSSGMLISRMVAAGQLP